MPRSPYRRNKVPFPPWFTKIETGMERKYIRIGETMIKSEAWKTLPSSTTKLLICMMYVANGKQHFQFPCHLAVQCGFSRSSFWRYRDELIAYGFIEVVANNKLQRRNNVYGFCSKFTRLARVRITPRRPRAINTILLQMTEAFITDVAGCIVVTADGHTTVRTGDGFYTEQLFGQIRATAGANLR